MLLTLLGNVGPYEMTDPPATLSTLESALTAVIVRDDDRPADADIVALLGYVQGVASSFVPAETDDYRGAEVWSATPGGEELRQLHDLTSAAGMAAYRARDVVGPDHHAALALIVLRAWDWSPATFVSPLIANAMQWAADEIARSDSLGPHVPSTVRDAAEASSKEAFQPDAAGSGPRQNAHEVRGWFWQSRSFSTLAHGECEHQTAEAQLDRDWPAVVLGGIRLAELGDLDGATHYLSTGVDWVSDQVVNGQSARRACLELI